MQSVPLLNTMERLPAAENKKNQYIHNYVSAQHNADSA